MAMSSLARNPILCHPKHWKTASTKTTTTLWKKEVHHHHHHHYWSQIDYQLSSAPFILSLELIRSIGRTWWYWWYRYYYCIILDNCKSYIESQSFIINPRCILQQNSNSIINYIWLCWNAFDTGTRSNYNKLQRECDQVLTAVL